MAICKAKPPGMCVATLANGWKEHEVKLGCHGNIQKYYVFFRQDEDGMVFGT